MIILDTHVWWWAASEPELLSDVARSLILETPPGERAVASISIWEMAMMFAKGRVQLEIPPENWLDHALNRTGLRVIGLTGAIAMDSCRLPGELHKDPADRLIVATARRTGSVLVTKDRKLLDYPFVESAW
jgi:PIN domain nuclease of toxin-antitoxin system